MFGMIKRAVGFVALLIVAAVIINRLPDQSTAVNPAIASSAAPQTVAVSPPISITAIELNRIYHLNEVAADIQFKQKNLLVAGTVTEISKSVWDTSYVHLSGGRGGFSNVMGSIDGSQVPQAAKLSIGQQVRLQCTGNGMSLGSPMLSNCFFR